MNCSRCGRPLDGLVERGLGVFYLPEPVCSSCAGFTQPWECGICNREAIDRLGFMMPEEIRWCEAYTGSNTRVARICSVCDGPIDTSSHGQSPIHPYNVQVRGREGWLEVCFVCALTGHLDGSWTGSTWILDERWTALAQHYYSAHFTSPRPQLAFAFA